MSHTSSRCTQDLLTDNLPQNLAQPLSTSVTNTLPYLLLLLMWQQAAQQQLLQAVAAHQRGRHQRQAAHQTLKGPPPLHSHQSTLGQLPALQRGREQQQEQQGMLLLLRGPLHDRTCQQQQVTCRVLLLLVAVPLGRRDPRGAPLAQAPCRRGQQQQQ